MTPTGPVAAVMVHVADVTQGLAWYRRAFPDAADAVEPSTGFAFLRLGNIQLEIVPADDKVGAGAAGSVVYWWVDDLAEAWARLRAAGATPYRGPMAIEAGHGMGQLRDPWGNCIGLRGPWTPPAPRA